MFLLSLGLIFCQSCVINEIGGASSKNPSKQIELSEGSKILISNAYEGLDSVSLIDCHTHIVGTGTNMSGTFVNKNMLSFLHPIERLKFKVYLSGAGIDNVNKSDEQYLNRLLNLIMALPHKSKFCLLAFDKYYDIKGNTDLKKTEFYVPNDYVFDLANQYPDYFIPVMSIHPYRKDAIKELEKWSALGGRIIKWLPNSMGIDPSNPICDSFYMKMKELNIVLLSHAGIEKAVNSGEDQKYGNPLLLRKPLNFGVKVIIAHCASLGEFEDLDNGSINKVSAFELFLRLMKEKKYEGLLFGDISAVTQTNRCDEPLTKLLDAKEIHHRLINGSDYPLPSINVVISTRKLEKLGYITKQERGFLNEIYDYNPLLFDFVLKRTIKSPQNKNKFDDSVFIKSKIF